MSRRALFHWVFNGVFGLLAAATAAALACSPRHQLDQHADPGLTRVSCVAVFPFASSGDNGEAGIGFSDLMAAELMKTGRFGVLDPEAEKPLLASRGKAVPSTPDADAGRQLGSLLGVEAVMVGEVKRYDYAPSRRHGHRPDVDLTARLVDVKTGRDLWRGSFAGNALPFFADANPPKLSDAAQAAVTEMVSTISTEAGQAVHPSVPPCWHVATPTPTPTPVVLAIAQTPAPTPTPELRYIVVDKTKKQIELKQTIHFKLDSAAFQDVPDGLLAEVAKVMKDNPSMVVRIEGHTDSTGKPNHNLRLSQARANAIRDWLVVNGGIDGGRLKAVGLGYQSPIADNRTSEGRAQNRRVEFHILSQ